MGDSKRPNKVGDDWREKARRLMARAKRLRDAEDAGVAELTREQCIAELAQTWPDGPTVSSKQWSWGRAIDDDERFPILDLRSMVGDARYLSKLNEAAGA